MMKKVFLFAVLCWAIGTTAQAQQADTTVAFTAIVHDFGDIVQNSGPQTHAFEFINTGTEPVTIQNVSASCGCTTPGWTREPVAPGQRGEVKATYNPSAVQPFDKTLTVHTSGVPSQIVLHIKGKVVAAPPADAPAE
jgi:archaellum component FlaG (FlaF/FlaG flagellin family)